MLGRANKTYAAQNPAASSATRLVQKTKVEQVLRPSSSPRHESITSFCKDTTPVTTTGVSTFRRLPASNTAISRPQFSTSALNARSPNISTGDNMASAKRSSSVVTLCNTPDSFLDNSLASDQPQASNAKVQQVEESDLLAYGIDPDDFTDDENLGLDFKSPSALPAPQVLKSEEKQAESLSGSQQAIVHSSLSWLPSSPSHHLPPLSRSASATALLAKRSASNDSTRPFPLPAAKKRTMPKHWSKAENERTAVSEAGISQLPTTPAVKQTDAFLWDATTSAVKAQKKQLKDNTKKQAIGEAAPGAREDSSLGPPGGTAKPHRKPTTPAAISLSTEQQHVKNLVCHKNASVFFTGPAGTGKSVLMRAIIRDLRKRFAKEPERLGVTASTGLAACNIGGMTLHSFAGIGLGKEDVQTLVRKIRRNPKAKARWLKTKILVIDEISMVDGDLFDKLSSIGRTIRNNGRPWGGIQLVLTGDFFQLPPVPDREKRDVKFAFEASTWNTSIDHTIGLSEVFRQKDPGALSKQRTIFKSLSRPVQIDDELEVTELFPTRAEVDSSNERRLHALKGKPRRYDALDSGEQDKREKLLQNMMAPKSLVLREGAQVMLIKNMDETLVNGSVGTVVKFMTESEFEQVGDNFEWTTDPVIKKRASMLNQYLNDGDNGSGSPVFPYVRFHAVDGTQRGILVRQEEWKVELPTGEVQASRHQLPLILAWALSIHKAQGQTLERVKVDLGRVFERGQAYVALSRATSKDGLQVLRFEKHKVMAHPRVVSFYSKLYSAESALKSIGGSSSILAFTRSTVLEPESTTNSFARRWLKPQ
ncbi:mitochondrial DNA helicase [Grosmannia clavigera kw1407]|uniref:ATP-dependent DNA helicase PIF1 n=1 Tax=Grosmannia clavigera (strain kw1407 / UAMH 11150) TaxID=655863 RepID=F0XHJ8_GROCL|nr:mitochondrial DNA helicase [Grosmannia clavigera kw1407]EFX02820.1 mitochondrial DNA helicase [Grosmannia clavigera kw1407]